jgi:TolB-like protein/tetratricopeptide (TPR) repeat protein
VTESKNAVFLSYAAEDAASAERLCAALRAAGIEVWFDQSELRGGDAWDAAIRKQIKACSLFIPLISANSQARAEGYFRLEWKLAVDRSHLMVADKAFLLPVVIDDTDDTDARVPDKFREVQWTSLPGGETPPVFIERLQHLLSPMEHQAPTTIRAVSAAPHALTTNGTIPEKSIAVLPFADMSAQKDQEYFSDGLAEALIDMLTQARDLRVPARTSSFSFKGKSDDIAHIAEKLRVAHVLEGSVRKAGNTVRVTAHLIRADSGYHLWSKTYDRDIGDIFKVQDEIAGIVVEALKARLLPPQGVMNPHRTSNTEAYDQYLIAKQLFDRRTVDWWHNAVAALQRSLALDPDYASAYAMLAVSITARLLEGADPAPLNAEQAIAAAERAVAISPRFGEAYSARGMVRSSLTWDWNGALADLEKALKLDPRSDASHHRYSYLLAFLGHLPEAIAEAQAATEIEPLDVTAWTILGWCHTAVGQFEASHRALSHALELNPAGALAIVWLALNEIAAGDIPEALHINSRQPFEPWRWAVLVIVEHTLGHARESQRLLDDLIDKYGRMIPFFIACVCAWRGEADLAFEWLERAYRQRDPTTVLLQAEYGWSQLRSDPRYGVFLRKMNFPA